MNYKSFLWYLLIGISILSTRIVSLQSSLINDNNLQIIQNNDVADDCYSPQIYEFITNFTLPLKDIQNLLEKQFSRLQIGNISGANNTQFYNIKIQTRLLSEKQTVSYNTSLKAYVINQQTQITITYLVQITQRRNKHNYNGTTTISHLNISYEKELTTNSNASIFSNVFVDLQASKMISNFSPNASSDDVKKMEAVVTGTSNSLYSSLKSQLSPTFIKRYLESNSVNSPLSRVYEKNPYQYQGLNNYKVNINTTTLTLGIHPRFNQTLINGLSGKFPANNRYCNIYYPDINFTLALMHYKDAFVRNFIEYSIANNNDWKLIQINKANIKSDLLQFYLMDLEYIVDGIFNFQADYSQKQIAFRCNINYNYKTKLDPDTSLLYQTLQWNCSGYILVNESTQIKIMDFQPIIEYTVQISISSSLSVQVKKLQLLGCKYNKVEKMQVVDYKLANKFIKSILYFFQGPTIGNNFKIPSNSKKVFVDSTGSGIWITY